MRNFHETWGLVAVALSGLTGLWGIGLALARRAPGRAFWVAAAIAIAGMLGQVVLGVVLFQQEGMQPGNQHVFYGIVIAFTFVFAYIYRAQLRKRPALAYGLLLLFIMGLGIRGILTFGHDF